MPRFVKSSSAYTSDIIDGPERRLFIAVLSQAIHDAFAKHVPPYEKNQAQAWLTGNSYDFRIICENAGRESKYVIEKIRKKILRDKGWNVDINVRITRMQNMKDTVLSKATKRNHFLLMGVKHG